VKITARTWPRRGLLGINHEDQVAAATAWVERYVRIRASRIRPVAPRDVQVRAPDTYVVDRDGAIGA
jgi:hypothetical protein